MKARKITDNAIVEKYLDNILDVLAEGIYISDQKGLTLKINKTYENLIGFRREDLIGRLVTDLADEGVFDIVLNPKIVKTGQPATSVQINKKGHKLVLNGYPIFDEDGEVALVVTFVRDITLMAQLKDQIAIQQQLIDKYQEKLEYLNRESGNSFPVITKNRKMIRLLNLLEKIAPTDATVLLTGETGVGKGVLARKVYEQSNRRSKPFFKVDCTSIPENLIESELFGYVPGAFSGAHAKGKAGYFEVADKGTLFLDEIGELPLSMQAKLLRVLQDHEVVRVGSTQVKKVDVRIIAATNRNLEEAVKEGAFRSDLFYRLRVAVLNIPPLRDRTNDILPLARHFLEVFSNKYKKKLSFTRKTEAVLKSYNWPGNVRELENDIQGIVITCDGETIETGDLPRSIRGDPNIICPEDSITPRITNTGGKSLKEIMAEVETDILKNAIEVHGSVSEVARVFKVNRTTIFRKLHRKP